MERIGSGFGKIISGYEFQINYNESKKTIIQLRQLSVYCSNAEPEL